MVVAAAAAGVVIVLDATAVTVADLTVLVAVALQYGRCP